MYYYLVSRDSNAIAQGSAARLIAAATSAGSRAGFSPLAREATEDRVKFLAGKFHVREDNSREAKARAKST